MSTGGFGQAAWSPCKVLLNLMCSPVHLACYLGWVDSNLWFSTYFFSSWTNSTFCKFHISQSRSRQILQETRCPPSYPTRCQNLYILFSCAFQMKQTMHLVCLQDFHEFKLKPFPQMQRWRSAPSPPGWRASRGSTSSSSPTSSAWGTTTSWPTGTWFNRINLAFEF